MLLSVLLFEFVFTLARLSDCTSRRLPLSGRCTLYEFLHGWSMVVVRMTSVARPIKGFCASDSRINDAKEGRKVKQFAGGMISDWPD